MFLADDDGASTCHRGVCRKGEGAGSVEDQVACGPDSEGAA